jgi:hypothetical protein
VNWDVEVFGEVSDEVLAPFVLKACATYGLHLDALGGSIGFPIRPSWALQRLSCRAFVFRSLQILLKLGKGPPNNYV